MICQRILTAMERTPATDFIFNYALQLAQMYEGELLLFHSLNLPSEQETETFLGIGTLADVDLYRSSGKLRHEGLQKDIEQVKGWLDTYAQQAADVNINADIDCRVGKPGNWICDLAKNWNADLIVLGRHGYSGLSELLLGSVSNYVLHHAPCSVLVVQGVNNGQLTMDN